MSPARGVARRERCRLPAFWAALDRVEGLGACALRLTIVTALRPKKVRFARWSWLEFSGLVLTVPGEVMKGKRSADVQPHRVALAPAALAVLVRTSRQSYGMPCSAAVLPARAALAGDALIVPSARRRTRISDMTLSAVMRRVNADRPPYAPPPWRDADGREAEEKALAHEVANEVSGAYRRFDLLDRRAVLMRDWTKFVAGAVRDDAALGPDSREEGESMTREPFPEPSH